MAKTILFTLWLVFSGVQCQAETIILFGNNANPPKIYLDQGRPQGQLIELMQHLDQQLPQTFKYRLYSWNHAYRSTLKGMGGLIGATKNKTLLKTMDFSDPIYFDELYLVVLKGNQFDYQQLSQLKGMTLGVSKNVQYGDDFEQAKKTILHVDEDNSPRQRLLKLLENRIDIALFSAGKATFDQIISADPRLEANKSRFVILPQPFKINPNFLCFGKLANKRNFLKAFNKALKQHYQSNKMGPASSRHQQANLSLDHH